jgi:uncharacterized membrane protein YhhN
MAFLAGLVVFLVAVVLFVSVKDEDHAGGWKTVAAVLLAFIAVFISIPH